MAAQKPEAPKSLQIASDHDQRFSKWIFLFYQWVSSTITTILSTFSSVDFVVGTASSSLGAERVATDTTTIDVSIATPGVITWAVIDASITNAKLADMAAWTYKIRNAATTGAPS